MKRPPVKRAEIRDHLLDTAIALFNQHGYRAAGIDLIIAKANIAKTTLYRHFATKEDLILAALKRRDEQARAEMRAFVEAQSDDPLARLMATFDYLERWFRDGNFKGCPFISAAAEHGDDRRDPVFQAAVLHKHQVLAYFEELARAARLSEPRRVAREINLLHEGAVTVALIDRDPKAARFAKQTARRLLALT